MRLSGATTFLWKYLFCGVWVVGFGSAIVSAVRRGVFDFQTFAGLGFPLIGFFFSLSFLGNLKSVYLDGGTLVISNMFRTIAVPLSDVLTVTDPDWTSHRRIFVTFKTPTEFGEEIVFMPTFLSGNPASLLRERVEAESAAASPQS